MAELFVIVEVDVRGEEDLNDLAVEIADRIFEHKKVKYIAIGTNNELLIYYAR